MGLEAIKPVFRGLRTTQAQSSLRIRAVWSATLLFRVLESAISKLATSEISFFYLVSVAEQAGLNLTLSETPKTGFVATRPIWDSCYDKGSNHIYFIIFFKCAFMVIQAKLCEIHDIFEEL